MANILDRNTNLIGWRVDYLSTEPLPEIPDEPIRSNAPVTRAVWTCIDLPAGLTLSADGKISGHPTVAGSYECHVSISTNWGSAEKTIRIRVE